DLARLSLEKPEKLKGQCPLPYYFTDKPKKTKHGFDTAVSTSVMYLIEDIPQHAKDLKEALKQGGAYYTSFAALTNKPSRQFLG
ncbi:methyltransferase, partial [Staphylococcus aureus]